MSGQPRITRRRALAIGGAAIGSALVAACAPTSPVAGTTGSSTPRTGGTISSARASKLVSPTDMLSALVATDYYPAQHIYEPLYQFKDGAIVGLLADKTVFSADGLTWTITLKSSVKFHDGTDFDAAAVKTNLDLRKAKATFLERTSMAPIREVRVVNPTTIQLLLTTPSGSLQGSLASIAFGMQSPTAMAKHADPVEYAKNAAGTGAFKPVGGPTADGEITVVRNDQYWGPKAYLDKIIFKSILDNGARSAALEAGDIQVAEIGPADFPRLQGDGKFSLMLPPHVMRGGTALWFNLAKAPFSDKRARQSVAYGVDGDALVKFLGELGKRADSVLWSTMPGYVASPLYANDLTKAKQLFAAAGLTPGTPLDFMVNTFGTWVTQAQAIKQNMDAIGFNTTIRPLATAAWLAEANLAASSAKWNLALDGMPNNFPDADSIFPRYFATATDTAGGGNWDHYRNDQFDSLLTRESATVDQATRNGLLGQMQRILWDDLPMLPLVWVSAAVATHKSVRDLDVNNLDGIWRFQRCWLG